MAAILFCPETGFNREDLKRNYGIFRIYRILLDLIYVRAIATYRSRILVCNSLYYLRIPKITGQLLFKVTNRDC